MKAQKAKIRFFTLEEANALIPELSLLIGKLIQKKEAHIRHHDMLFMHQMIEQAEGHIVDSRVSQDLEREIQWMEDNIAALESDIRAIQTLGCILRSLDTGFVDFLSDRNGERIFLCWKRGEKEIRYYHSIQKGACQRIPLF